MEIKLTDEQVRKASMEFSRVTSTGPFPNLFPGLRAAAPHLQAKWKPPTNEEIMYVRNLVGSITGVETAQAISDFVNLRNENLLPQPDKREKALQIIQSYAGMGPLGAKELYEKLAALDEK